MSYNFSSSQMAVIQAAYSDAVSGAITWSIMYDVILSNISAYQGVPATGVDPAVWAWVNGARQVNAGTGAYSEFIRTYSEHQYSLRFSTPATISIQEASDSLAKDFVDEILLTSELLDLHRIGQVDGGRAISDYFHGDEGGWSGNPLFIFLGDDSFYADRIREDQNDSYDFAAFIESSESALGEISDIGI